jgi:hypothetical protein
MADEKQMALSKTDLSRSSFRGSGSQFRTDRLLLGKGPFGMVPGQEAQIVEKIVHVEDERTKQLNADLRSRLNEALMRLLIVSADNQRMSKKMVELQHGGRNAFDNQLLFDNNAFKAEITRLQQLLKDKEKEIEFVRDSEVRKSAVQSGDLSMRLALLTKENKRLQEAQMDKINRINGTILEISNLKEDYNRNVSSLTNDPRIHEMERLLKSKDQEIAQFKDRLNSAKNEVDQETRGRIMEMSQQIEGLKTALAAQRQNEQNLTVQLRSAKEERDQVETCYLVSQGCQGIEAAGTRQQRVA